MQLAKDKVGLIHYTLKNTKGDVVDSSEGKAPLPYLHGAANLISGMENALEGKAQGDKFDVTIAPADAYGERTEDLIHVVPIDNFPEKDQVKVGVQFQAETPQGMRVATVVNVAEDKVTVDFNHPLAGETLHFNVEVMEVRDATEEEIAHGHIHADGGGCC